MDIQSLKIFVEVATRGGFNRAASNLHIAQSALSRRLANLEHELGTTLLIRNKRGVQLTAAGTLLLERSEALLRHFNQVHAEMLAEAKEPHGEISLGLPPSLLRLSTKLLSTLSQKYPRVFVRVYVSTSIELRAMLLSGKLDVAVYANSESEALLATKPLFTEPLHLIGAQSREVRKADAATISKLPLVLTGAANNARVLIDKWAAEHHVSLTIVSELNDVPLMLAVAQDGVAFTILPKEALAINVAGGLFAREIPGLELSWIVANSKEKPLSTAAKCVIELIVKLFSQP